MSMFCSRVKLRSILYKGPLESINIKTATKQRRTVLARRGSSSVKNLAWVCSQGLSWRVERFVSVGPWMPVCFQGKIPKNNAMPPSHRETDSPSEPLIISEWFGQYVRAGSIPLAARAPQTCCLTWMPAPLYQSLGHGLTMLTTDAFVSLFGLYKENDVNSNVTSFLAPKSRFP